MADRESLARQRESERGSYWKRNDSMRLVHLLVDPDLKPAFLAAESQGPGADAGSVRRFWERAAAKFNDDDWQPPHLFPTDPHLARSSAFTPAKRSKEVRFSLPTQPTWGAKVVHDCCSRPCGPTRGLKPGMHSAIDAPPYARRRSTTSTCVRNTGT